jgi:preprotein translocase subunit SecD
MRIVAAAVLALLAVQEEKVENPQFKAWSGFKVGSWVRHKMELDAGGRMVTMEVTATLVEATPEKLVVDRAQKMDMGGRVMELPPRKEEILPKIEKGKGSVKITEKEEEIEAGGKKLKCKLAETEMEQNGERMQGKTWIHPDVPGGMVKGEFTSAKIPKPMTMTATGWEKN